MELSLTDSIAEPGAGNTPYLRPYVITRRSNLYKFAMQPPYYANYCYPNRSISVDAEHYNSAGLSFAMRYMKMFSYEEMFLYEYCKFTSKKNENQDF